MNKLRKGIIIIINYSLKGHSPSLFWPRDLSPSPSESGRVKRQYHFTSSTMTKMCVWSSNQDLIPLGHEKAFLGL